MRRVSVISVVIGRCVLASLVLAAAADAIAQPHDWPVDLRVSNARRATHVPATSPLLTTLGSLDRPQPATLPENLDAHDHLRSLVELMWQRSPTFDRQCARLAEASVQVTLRLGVIDRRQLRARSWVDVVGGRPKHAAVRIGVTHRSAAIELIAHELEHVIEQLDGIDLASQITRGGASQGRLVGHYETLRAMEMGRRVAEEVRRNLEQRGKGAMAERR